MSHAGATAICNDHIDNTLMIAAQGYDLPPRARGNTDLISSTFPLHHVHQDHVLDGAWHSQRTCLHCTYCFISHINNNMQCVAA